MAGWTEAVKPLRGRIDATSEDGLSAIVAAIESLSSVAASSSFLDQDEVCSDLYLVSQALQTIPGGRGDAARPPPGGIPDLQNLSLANRDLSARVAFCRLVADCASKFHIQFPAAHVPGWASTILGWVEHARALPAGEGDKLLADALRVLANVLHENAAALDPHGRESALQALFGLCSGGSSAPRSRPGSGRSGSFGRRGVGGAGVGTETQRAALQVLGSLCTRAGGCFTADQWRGAVGAASAALSTACSDGRLSEDTASSRFYAAVLRALHVAVSEGRSVPSARVPELVESCRRFLLYGLRPPAGAPGGGPRAPTPPDSPATPSRGGGGGGGGGYVPPHLRRQRAEDDAAAAAAASGSESERESDSDGSVGGGFERSKSSSRVRQGAMQCLQAVARVAPRSLHAHWASLLPSSGALQLRPYTPTLLTAVLFDPAPKARVAAAGAVAALLEGPPQRQHMAVAEVKPARGGGRVAFTTLSARLGGMCVELHVALLRAVAREDHLPALGAVMRALAAAVAATPYGRLPRDLPLAASRALEARVRALLPPAGAPAEDDACAAAASAVACMGALLGGREPLPALESELAGGGAEGGGAGWLALLVQLAGAGHSAAVRAESLGALRAAAKGYHAHVRLAWPDISALIGAALRESSSPAAAPPPTHPQGGDGAGGAEDKVAVQAARLLGEYLRSAGGGLVAGGGDAAEEAQGPALPVSPGAAGGGSGPTSPASAPAPPAPPAEETESLWLATVSTLLLPVGLAHASPGVRAASLQCLTSLTPGALAALPAASRGEVLGIAMVAAARDEAPPVRAAACKALGAVLGLEPVRGSPGDLEGAAGALLAGLADDHQAVRIAAAWGAANLCDVLRAEASAREQAGEGGGRGGGAGEGGVGDGVVARLAAGAMSVCGDNDKVRANAVRALGNLAAFAGGGGAAAGAEGGWLSEAVGCLLSCLRAGNVKVQWNACYALASFMRSRAAGEHPELRALVPVGIRALAEVLTGSSNFKIRTHAAAALRTPPGRDLYGDAYGGVVAAVAGSLESVGSGEVEPPPQPGRPPRAGGGGVGDYADFKYLPQLKAQLLGTLLHLLGLGGAGDLEACGGVLEGGGGGAVRALMAAAQRCVADAEEAAAAAAGGDGAPPVTPPPSKAKPGAAGEGEGALDLPSDPFGQGNSPAGGAGAGASPVDERVAAAAAAAGGGGGGGGGGEPFLPPGTSLPFGAGDVAAAARGLSAMYGGGVGHAEAAAEFAAAAEGALLT